MTDAGGAGGRAPGRAVVPPAATLALRMEDVTHWVIERVAKMPREHKFALGEKLVEKLAPACSPASPAACARFPASSWRTSNARRWTSVAASAAGRAACNAVKLPRRVPVARPE